jgi:lysocardiolipin and lysophospholipid acyltransferase
MLLQPLKGPVKIVPRVVAWAKGLLVAAIFLPTVFLVNAAQFLSCIIQPFSKKAFRKANRLIPDVWLSTAVWWAKHICGTRFVITGNDLSPGENAVLIGNHQSFADAMALFALAHRHGRLGDLSYFSKDSIKYWPGIGCALRFVNCIFVKRNWDTDRQRLKNIFSKITENDLPFWFINFVEGTRLSPENLIQAKTYAEKNDMRAPENLLIPRTKGFTATIEGLRGNIDAVYDMSIGYERGLPSLWQLMMGLVKRIHIHIRRFPLDELPVDAGELSDWLKERFIEKDKLLDSFYRQGKFQAKGDD